MKHRAYHIRREIEFQVGDKSILDLGRAQFKPLVDMFSLLLWHFEGPFKVLKKIGNVTSRLELLGNTRAHHLVFHVNQLNPYMIDEAKLNRANIDYNHTKTKSGQDIGTQDHPFLQDLIIGVPC